MFPLGNSLKSDVRVEATERGLLVADKPDSHDICFIANGDTKGFLESHLGQRPGHVVDENGEVLGDHSGAFAFTVGQRRGLGLTVAAADREPRYVLSVDPGQAEEVVERARLLALPARIVGRTGGVAIVLKGEAPLKLDELAEIHECWLPEYMAGEV